MTVLVAKRTMIAMNATKARPLVGNATRPGAPAHQQNAENLEVAPADDYLLHLVLKETRASLMSLFGESSTKYDVPGIFLACTL